MNTRKTKLIISMVLIWIMLFQISSCGMSGSSRQLKSIPTFNVSSNSINARGRWIDEISNTSVGKNDTPQLTWEPVDGAEEYVIYMFDVTSNMFVHWKAIDIHQTSIQCGWGNDLPNTEYIGPYPPKGEHTYVVYIFALGTRIFDESTVPEGVFRASYFPGDVDKPLDNETLLKLNMLLNTNLNGLSVDQINLALIARLKEQAGIHDEIISQVLDTVADTITEDEDLQVYTSGATNIFKYPELSDSKKASELLDTFEEKQSLIELLTDKNTDEETGIQVYIGDESPISTMKDCSIVTATYELGDGVKGTIGIVGPKRMDYENVVDNIKSLKGQLDKLLRNENKKE